MNADIGSTDWTLEGPKSNACKELQYIVMLRKFVITYASYHMTRTIFQTFAEIFDIS